jgi:predicted dehydrogenase
VHAETYSTYHRASLAAVCDLDESRARNAADRWVARKVYTDYREMLRDPDIDAVAVATPDFAHREPIVAAARAGKHHR